METLTRYGLFVQIQARFNVLELFIIKGNAQFFQNTAFGFSFSCRFCENKISGCLMRPLDFQFLTDSVKYCNKNEK